MKQLIDISLILTLISTSYDQEFLDILEDMREIMYNDGFHGEEFVNTESLIAEQATTGQYPSSNIEEENGDPCNESENILNEHTCFLNSPLPTDFYEQSNSNTQLMLSNGSKTYKEVNTHNKMESINKFISPIYHDYPEINNKSLLSNQPRLCEVDSQMNSDILIKHENRPLEIPCLKYINEEKALERPMIAINNKSIDKHLTNIHCNSPKHVISNKNVYSSELNLIKNSFTPIKISKALKVVLSKKNILKQQDQIKRKKRELVLINKIKKSRFSVNNATNSSKFVNFLNKKISISEFSDRQVNSPGVTDVIDCTEGKIILPKDKENQINLSAVKNVINFSCEKNILVQCMKDQCNSSAATSIIPDLSVNNGEVQGSDDSRLIYNIIVAQKILGNEEVKDIINKKNIEEFSNNMNKEQSGFGEVEKKLYVYHLKIKESWETFHSVYNNIYKHLNTKIINIQRYLEPYKKLENHVIAYNILYLMRFFNSDIQKTYSIAIIIDRTIGDLYHLTYQAQNNSQVLKYDQDMKIFITECKDLLNVLIMFKKAGIHYCNSYSRLYKGDFSLEYEIQKFKFIRAGTDVEQFSRIEGLYEINKKVNIEFINLEKVTELFEKYSEELSPHDMNQKESLNLHINSLYCKKSILLVLHAMDYKLMNSKEITGLLMRDWKIRKRFMPHNLLNEFDIDSLFCICNGYIKIYMLFAIKKHMKILKSNISVFFGQIKELCKQDLKIHNKKSNIRRNFITYNSAHKYMCAKLMIKIKVYNLNMIAFCKFQKKYDTFYNICSKMWSKP